MLSVDLLRRFLLEGVGRRDLRRGDDRARTIGVGNGSFARFGFGAHAPAWIVVGGGHFEEIICLLAGCCEQIGLSHTEVFASNGEDNRLQPTLNMR